MTDATLKSIDTKLDMFMESQKEVNKTVSEAIKAMAATSSKSEAMQVEINGIHEKVTDLSHELSTAKSDISGIKTKVEVTSTLVDQTQELKKLFARSMMGVFFMFVVSIGSQHYKAEAAAEASARINADLISAILLLVNKKE